MEDKVLMDALVQLKRMGNLLNEALDLTQQIAQASDRNDQVAIQMLYGMRQDPIDKLEAADQALRDQLYDLTDVEEYGRLAAILNGTAEPEARERPLAEQAASNRRRLKQVLDLDRILNQKLAREKSIYR
ncbi:MAG: hypothetical protein HFF18_13390 [Oscillospiraceae bacterium]|nr:hypothetical protein [Oscillospiraceae bacterium]